MKILITGKDGQVGYALNQQLKNEKSIETVATSRNELDITEQVAVNSFVREFCPDIIINCAAYTAVDQAEQEPILANRINCDGPKHLAIAAKETGAQLIHLSTDYVFDGTSATPYTEETEANPQSVYGKTKLAGEKAIADNLDKHIIIRTAWVFGEHGANFVKTMLRLALDRDELSIVADQLGCPTYAADIAQTLIRIAKTISSKPVDVYGIYNYAGVPHTNWYEFAEAIFTEAVKQNVLPKAPKVNAITTAEYPTPAKRPANSRLECKKIESVFNIQPAYWQNGLKNLKDYR